MVEKLYLADPYRTECEATVVAVQDGRVRFDRTIFFPEGGGQLGDTGTAGPNRIVDAQKVGGLPFGRPGFPLVMLGGEIAHYLQEHDELPAVGDVVELRLDWGRRYDIMRHHSAAHLAHHFATQTMDDLYVQGCRISNTEARFDYYSKTRILPEQLAEWEGLANEMVKQDGEIRNEPVDGNPEALMWRCGSITMPCGGTHVRSTREISNIRLRRKRQGTNLERLYIYCESRHDDANAD